MKLYTSIAVSAALFHAASTQDVTCNLTPSYPAPVMADGWESRLIVTGLTRPRSILFDNAGGLLVVQQRTGITHMRLADGNGTCLSVAKRTELVRDSSLNHGLALSNDGRTLYASTADVVYAWDYDPAGPSVSGNRRTVVGGMDSGGHTSRTLLMSQKQPGVLVVSRGSDGNFDLNTADITSGRSQIKAFDLKANNIPTVYEYSTQGRLLGWGLRNSVGVAEEPVHGGIYSVENSADQIERAGVDIHSDNPGEEMNYHGFLNGSTENQGGNYGYPYCLAVWSTNIPNNASLQTGDQMSLEQTSTSNDTFCKEERVAPRLTFQAHMAPLDIKFNSNGTEAYVSFHGSWNRELPVGYKVSALAFANGSPVAASNSRTAAVDIMTNPNTSSCADAVCFRPTGLVLDSHQRIFMTSDATGEIWVIRRTNGTAGSGTGTVSGGGQTPSGTAGGASSTPTGAAGKPGSSIFAWIGVTLAAWAFALLL